jgi:hypothetical protein
MGMERRDGDGGLRFSMVSLLVLLVFRGWGLQKLPVVRLHLTVVKETDRQVAIGYR